MIGDCALNNFRRFLASRHDLLPNLPRRAEALGVYDSRYGLRRGRDDDPGLPLRDFAPGGRFDTASTPLDAPRRLASTPSREDWDELRDVFCEDGESPESESKLEDMLPRRTGRDDELEPRGAGNLESRGGRVSVRRSAAAMDARGRRYADLIQEVCPHLKSIGFA
jgi:hypothetical protein